MGILQIERMEWLRLRNWLLSGGSLITLGLVIAGTACSAFVFFNFADTTLRNAVLIGGIALGGWLFTSGVNLLNRVSQYTLSLLFGVRMDSELKKSVRTLIALSDENGIVPESTVSALVCRRTTDQKISTRYENDRLDQSLDVWHVLNFFETLSLSVRLREADEDMLKNFFRSMLITGLVRCQHFVRYYQRQSPSALENWVWLVKRWGGDTSFLNR